MDYKNIFADQSTIQINVMKVDGKRLTKSIIEQIPMVNPFDKEYNFTGDKVFGFVKLELKDPINPTQTIKLWGIAQYKDKLIKFSYSDLITVGNLKLDDRVSGSPRSRIFKLFDRKENPIQEKYLGEEGEYFSVPHELQFKDFFTEVAVKKAEVIINNAKEFSAKLRDHQIYI